MGQRHAEHHVVVAAAGHEVVGGERIGPCGIERRVADLDRDDAAAGVVADVGLDGEAGDLGNA